MEAETITVVAPPYGVTDCYDDSNALNGFPPIFEGLVAHMVIEDSVVVEGKMTQTTRLTYPEQDERWRRGVAGLGIRESFMRHPFVCVGDG